MEALLGKLGSIWPEIVLLTGAVACLAAGLNTRAALRKTTPWVAAFALVLAGLMVYGSSPETSHPLGLFGMAKFVKLAVLGVSLLLLAVAAGVPDALMQHKRTEAAATFDAGASIKGEFYAFFLLSITGVMLTAGATDLVWLFLALELVSLPTYVMIATTRDTPIAQESAIKYFFLGAMSAAVFLYGFALIYGATGYTDFAGIRDAVAMQGVSPMLIVGVMLAVLGLCFKVAAVPMHVYAADVYQGAATPVTAFLAFVPKAAGFVALMLVLSLVGWPLPMPVVALLSVIAVLTMTMGNLLACVQGNLKRVLAYSSIAQSGYLMLGLIAGPVLGADLPVSQTMTGEALHVSQPIGNGLAAVLFYLPAYGLATIAGFGVLAVLWVDKGENADPLDDEAQTFGSISGLWHRHPFLAGVLLVSMLSLVGLPPLAGFMGKVMIGSSIVNAPLKTLSYVLLIALVVNSAISASYYLRIVITAFFGRDAEATHVRATPLRFAAAAVAALLAFGLGGYLATPVAQSAHEATQHGINADTPARTDNTAVVGAVRVTP